MPVPVACPDCDAKLKAPDKARGKALKCPKCGGRVPVPADGGGGAAPAGKRSAGGAKRRRREPAAAAAGVGPGGNSGEFIAGLDLSRAEDTETEICPKCGAEVTEEDEECPQCGADLLTGGKGRTLRRKERFKSRGEDPRTYYKKAPGDAWAFLKKNMDVAVRLGVLATLAGAVASVCWLAIAYCTYLPPRLFWGLPAVVATLFLPGCLWVLQQSVTELTFTEKLKFKRFRFDALECVSRAPRLVLWAAVALWPFTVLDLLTTAGWLAMGLSPWLLWGALGLHAVALLVCWPAGLGHMAMPVPAPGWNFLVVGTGTAKNLGPALFWVGLTFAAFLPFLAGVGAVAALAGPRLSAMINTLLANGRAIRAADAASEEGGGRAPDATLLEVDWNALLIPGAALVPLAFLFAFAAVYAARPAGLLAKMFRPSLGLITLAKEKKYVPKLKRKDELADLDAEPEGLNFQKVGVILGVTAVLGVCGGLAYSVVGGSVAIGPGIGLGLLFAAGLSGSAAGFAIVVAAFNESTTWGLLALLVPGAALVFVVTHWQKAQYAFVWNVGAALLSITGFIVAIVTGFDLTPPAPPA